MLNKQDSKVEGEEEVPSTFFHTSVFYNNMVNFWHENKNGINIGYNQK